MTHVATWYLRCECQRVPNHPRTPIVNRVDARVTVLALQPSRCLLKDTVYTPQPELWQLKVVSRLFLHFSIAAHSAQPTQVPSNSTVVSRTNGIVMKDITSTNYSSLSPPSLSFLKKKTAVNKFLQSLGLLPWQLCSPGTDLKYTGIQHKFLANGHERKPRQCCSHFLGITK